MVKSVNAALNEAQKSSDFEAKKSNSNPDLAQTITIDIEQISEAKSLIQAVAKKQIKKDIGHRTELKTQVTNSVKAFVKKQYLSPKENRPKPKLYTQAQVLIDSQLHGTDVLQLRSKRGVEST